MHVAHLLHSMDVAGAEKLVYDMIDLLADRVRSSVLCLDHVGDLGRELAHRGVRVACLHRKPGLDSRLPFRLARLLRRLRVDVLHCHQYTPYFYGALARALTPRVKLIFTEHGRHWPDRLRPRRVIANQLFQVLTDRYTAVSAWVKRHLVRYEKMPGRRIAVIYNGLHPGQFDGPVDRAAKRRQLGLAPDAPLVGTVARLAPVKDQATLLRAFARVHAARPDSRLLIAGDGPLREALQRQTRDLGLDGAVLFLGLRRDVPELLQALDVFVLSSLSEGTSVTLLEAMASALPCVATAVGGNPEVIQAGHSGLLTPRGDAQALADCLQQLLADPGLRRRLGQAARQRVRQRFTYPLMVYEFLKLYAALCPGRLKLGSPSDELRRLQR